MHRSPSCTHCACDLFVIYLAACSLGIGLILQQNLRVRCSLCYLQLQLGEGAGCDYLGDAAAAFQFKDHGPQLGCFIRSFFFFDCSSFPHTGTDTHRRLHKYLHKQTACVHTNTLTQHINCVEGLVTFLILYELFPSGTPERNPFTHDCMCVCVNACVCNVCNPTVQHSGLSISQQSSLRTSRVRLQSQSAANPLQNDQCREAGESGGEMYKDKETNGSSMI